MKAGTMGQVFHGVSRAQIFIQWMKIPAIGRHDRGNP